MTKEFLEKRIAELRSRQQQLLSTAQQAHNEAMAIEGAIQDCNYWIAQVDKPEETEEVKTEGEVPRPM